MGRLLVAHVLRLIVALSVGLTVVLSVITMVGLTLAATGSLEHARGYGAGEIARDWGVAVLLLGSVARLAHLSLAKIVDIRPRPKPGS